MKERLAQWEDLEYAAFFLARTVGIMGPEVAKMSDAQAVFWSKNTVGDGLYRMLAELVKMGVLLENEDDSSLVKWNPVFKGYWEK